VRRQTGQAEQEQPVVGKARPVAVPAGLRINAMAKMMAAAMASIMAPVIHAVVPSGYLLGCGM
jgi:hypothetical protein